MALVVVAVLLIGGTGQAGAVRGADGPVVADAGVTPSAEHAWASPSSTAAPPAVLGAVADPAGRLWVRADRPGNGSLGMPVAPWEAATLHRAAATGDSGWWMPAGSTGTRWIPIAWSVDAGDVTLSVSGDGPNRATASITLHADADAPVATLEPLRVEQGELVLRWTESDGDGSGIVERTLRTETALTTPTGCGMFEVTAGMALGSASTVHGGADGHGNLSLGPPPSTGCLRATLALTDLVGQITIVSSTPYRVAPPTTRPPTKAAPARWSGRWNLYRPSAFVTQKTFQWCVAASVQMMVNLVRHHSDRTAATQRTMIRYAQRWDNGPYGAEGGTDVTGWITALRHFGAGKYRAVGANSPERALRIAATAMRQTGRPAGILVMEGRHAWVLHGFESRTDPQVDRRAVIRAVRISGPLYPIQQTNGYDPRPNTRLTVRALERYFQPSIVGSLAGKYVVVIPSH